MTESDNSITVITGEQVQAHPFYKERASLDKVSEFDWLMIVGAGLTTVTGFRFTALTTQLLGNPLWILVFFFVLFTSMILMSLKFQKRMPRLINTITICSFIGFLIGFLT